jgi:hypothetical protein
MEMVVSISYDNMYWLMHTFMLIFQDEARRLIDTKATKPLGVRTTKAPTVRISSPVSTSRAPTIKSTHTTPTIKSTRRNVNA